MIDQAYTCVTNDRWYGHASVWEFSYWAMQSIAVIFVLTVIIVFFYEAFLYYADS
jgi:hypothetical protein